MAWVWYLLEIQKEVLRTSEPKEGNMQRLIALKLKKGT